MPLPFREIFALFRELVQTKSRSSSRFAESRSKRSIERFACFHLGSAIRLSLLVGLGGLEPPTSRLSGVRSNRLSYKPIIPDQVLTLAPAPLDGRSLRRLRALLVPSQKAAPFSGVCSDCPATLSLPFRFRSIAGLCVQTQSAGGDKRDRTVDLLLAKQALSQLSYTPISWRRSVGRFLPFATVEDSVFLRPARLTLRM